MKNSPGPVCATCEKPLASWPWRHEGYRGAAGPQIASPQVGDQFACQTPLCNRYGLVLRIADDKWDLPRG